MRTSQGCFCLDVIGASSVGGKNVSVRIQALVLILGLSRPRDGKPLQTFIDLLVNHGSTSRSSRGRGVEEKKD